MPRRHNPYDARYRKARARILASRPRCQLRYEGCTQVADTIDHQPPLCTFPPGQWRGELVPACETCNKRSGGWRLANTRRGYRVRPLAKLAPEHEDEPLPPPRFDPAEGWEVITFDKGNEPPRRQGWVVAPGFLSRSRLRD